MIISKCQKNGGVNWAVNHWGYTLIYYSLSLGYLAVDYYGTNNFKNNLS